uniref:Uncharacterized protein n=1 Tax=Romanomermis culicivorax TaxID=13658 RepID=A0A915KR60_ROMCU
MGVTHTSMKSFETSQSKALPSPPIREPLELDFGVMFRRQSETGAKNPHKPSSWLAYLIDNGPGEVPLCLVSLLSRTPGQKAESTDLLITLADCVMRKTENGLEELNANDLLVEFLHFNSSGVQDDKFKHAITQVLYEDGGKSGEDRVALLRMDKSVTSGLDLQALIVPSSKPNSYVKCLMTGWLQEVHDKTNKKAIPTMFRVELTDETCNNFNITEEERAEETDGKKQYRFEIISGTPIVCYTNSENSPQVQGFVKQFFNDYLHTLDNIGCITAFPDFVGTLMRHMPKSTWPVHEKNKARF